MNRTCFSKNTTTRKISQELSELNLHEQKQHAGFSWPVQNNLVRMKLFKASLGLAFLLVSVIAQGGGIVTNTNQSAAWVRMYARDASQDLDAVYYNPAGLTALGKGLYFSINNQSLFSTRTIKNNYPYLNSHDYIGNVSAPLFPGIYGAYSTGKFVFSLGFNPVGGGGNATYEDGLPSFELGISDLKPALASKGVTAYSSDVYFKGSSVFYGTQLGVSYKINDMVSVFAGGRYVYAVNTYQGHLNSNTIYFGTTPMSASSFFTSAVGQANAGIVASNGAISSLQQLINGGAGSLTLAQAEGAGAITSAQRAQLEGGLTSLGINPAGLTITQTQGAYSAAIPVLTATAQQAGAKAKLLRDQSADVKQTGSAITPILGVNLNLMENKLNIGLKYEFITKITLKNDTKKDITTGYTATGDSITQFPNGLSTPSDMPALFTLGAAYKVLKDFKVSAGFHYYFDKNANYGHSLNGVVVENKDVIDKNNYELALGFEYNINEKILLSAGYLYTKTGVMVGYNTDLSYSLGSSSVGFGGKLAVSPRFDLDLGFSYTEYEPGSKTYDHTIPTTPSQTLTLKEKYYKNVLIFAIGINVKLSKAQ
jgi:long-subunit fatty acid transport protein